MPTYIATIISKKRGSKRNKKRKIEVFAECVGDAEKMILPTLKRGEKLYDIGGKMTNMMACENAVNRRKRKDF